MHCKEKEQNLLKWRKTKFGQWWCSSSKQNKWCISIFIFIGKNTNDLLMEAKIMHNLLAKSLWQYKIRYGYNKLDTFNDKKKWYNKVRTKIYLKRQQKFLSIILRSLVDFWSDTKNALELLTTCSNKFSKHFCHVIHMLLV